MTHTTDFWVGELFLNVRHLEKPHLSAWMIFLYQRHKKHIDCISTSRTSLNNAALSSSVSLTLVARSREYSLQQIDRDTVNTSLTPLCTHNTFKHRDAQVQQRLRQCSYRKTSAYINLNGNQREGEIFFSILVGGFNKLLNLLKQATSSGYNCFLFLSCVHCS